MSLHLLTVLAQSEPPDSASAAAAIFGVVLLVGVLSVLALFSRSGRRLLLPLIAVLIGLLILVTSISDASSTRFSALTVLGLFFGGLLTIGGFGALREGIAVPPVEGVEPTIAPARPRITPDD